jgi:hypothetical protein
VKRAVAVLLLFATVVATAAIAAATTPSGSTKAGPIDRHALVTRHNPVLTQIDPHAPVMLGNGNLGFTADITGLQTFPDQYSSLAPLLTMAQWAWHSFPNPQQFTEASGLVPVPVPERGDRPYSYFRDFSEVQKSPALQWLRENPHRFSLGRIGLVLRTADGREADFTQLSEMAQELDLWTGTLRSHFVFAGVPVDVETRVHPDRDMVLVDIHSALLTTGQLAVRIRYPGVAQNLNPDPSDWVRIDRHQTQVLTDSGAAVQLERRLDDTVFYSTVAVRSGRVQSQGPHQFMISAGRGERMTVSVSFDRKSTPPPRISGAAAARAVSHYWRSYWMQGGMIDFSGSTDPRAAELERRVVLSQYLAAINQSGELPPQEEGLFSNSWNGKFHLEMHAWHSGHFASWNRPKRLERSLAWYLQQLPVAQAVAQRQGVRGAWWAKMAGPEGRNSPSTINPFIMWQQPHPIYMAELLWRQGHDRATLNAYAELVEQTAWLLASWPRFDAQSAHYVLGPPVIPVQENHPPLSSINPAFEVEYFRYGLRTAQQWRERRGLPRVPEWDDVIARLAPPIFDDGLLRPLETVPDFWRMTRTKECSRNATRTPCLNRDHPSFLMAYGLIASDRLDVEAMRRTLNATEQHWDLRQTWGWDFPMLAMTAARLGEPEKALDWLFADYPNNTWGVTGMTPRMSLEEVPPGASQNDVPHFRRMAETYFPSNGSLLLAVGMMAAGWSGTADVAPGFPRTGWKLKVEGIDPLP